MLNIQYGDKEFNLPYALTKSIGEVWLVVITVRTFFFIQHFIHDSLHEQHLALSTHNTLCVHVHVFRMLLFIFVHNLHKEGGRGELFHATPSCVSYVPHATTATPVHDVKSNKAQNMT